MRQADEAAWEALAADPLGLPRTRSVFWTILQLRVDALAVTLLAMAKASPVPWCE